jgi:lysozyme family protein
MTVDQLITGILLREGGYRDDPSDRGGPTNFGITAATLGEWRRLGRPATRDEVRALETPEARAIYRARYVRPFETVPFGELQAQLVDIGV